MKTNLLYYGDNLDILRHGYIDPESVDLVYLDPPFNSNASYNVIFKDESGHGTDAQIAAFDDTWHWGPEAEHHYLYLTNSAYHKGKVPSTVSALIGAFHTGIGPSPMLAYVVEMAVRLVELHRVLKSTGSLYLHCDPTASHYLKLVLDSIFGPKHFRNEIIWKRSHGHNTARGYGANHDTILFYSRSDTFTWNNVYQRYDAEYVDRHYRHADADGRRYKHENPTYAGVSNGPTGQSWRGINPTAKGRHWFTAPEELEKLDAAGMLYWPKKSGAWPYLKLFLDERQGIPAQEIWADIDPINMVAKERLGYPTQKPIALLERIIDASSKPGDVVLDPFCGCGTALVAAQKLGRRWIGIDVTYLAIAVMQARLRDSVGILVQIEGSPTEVKGALKLAQQLPNGREQFELWALTLVGAMPQGGIQKKGADKGVDGVVSFTGAGWKAEICIVSVKSGGTGAGDVQGLKGAMETHGAAMGLFVTLEEPSGPMKAEAASAGYYHSDISGKDYPRLQILTIRELLEDGKKPELPLLVMPAYQKAEPVKKATEQSELFG